MIFLNKDKAKMERKLPEGFRVDPEYDHYAFDNQGQCIHIQKMKINKGIVNNAGYKRVSIRGYKIKKSKQLLHRRVYHIFNGNLEDGLVIDHINGDKLDNRACNLQQITQQENTKRGAGKIKGVKARKVEAICLNTDTAMCFRSLWAASRYLGIARASISAVCRNLTKSAHSKKDGFWYKFKYI